MADIPSDAVNVFEFMLVRSAQAVDKSKRRREYISDQTLDKSGVGDSDLFSSASQSDIGKFIYNRVFCPPSGVTSVPDVAKQSLLWSALLQELTGIMPACPYQAPGKQLEGMGERNYVPALGKYYLIPDRLADIDDALCRRLPTIQSLLDQPPLKPDGTLDAVQLRKSLVSLFDNQPLYDVAFDRNTASRSASFATARRKLFDTLYLLYVLRRFVRVDLEAIIGALAAIHTLEALAWDDFLQRLIANTRTSADDHALFVSMQSVFPELLGWDFAGPKAPFWLIDDLSSLRAHLGASPVVHPLFARLYGFRRPFTYVRPIGIGDLKVVKQWLCKYRAGEIAYVENVLEGEEKTRVHRRLEKSEDTASYLSERQDETQRDTQGTDRFELKREADQAIKTDLSVNANASLTYRQGPVVVTAGGGMAYARSQNDQIKTAANYSREVIDKAVKRVQSRASEQRSSTRLFETEETNTHGLKNPAGKGHISGIYRWLDKVYRAQLFNYGKRMMFEFVLPEPAAFLVESRLRSFEAGLDVPQVPQSPGTLSVVMPVASPEAINRAKFQELSRTYDLSAFEFPAEERTITFLDPATGQALLHRQDLPDDDWSAASYRANLNVRNYQLMSVRVDGYAQFRGRVADGEPANSPRYYNTLVFYVNGVEVHTYERRDEFEWEAINYVLGHTPVPILEDETSLTIGVRDGNFYNLTVSGTVQILPAAMLDWQSRVYNAIWKVEAEKLASAQARLQQEYESRMSTYRNRVEQLRAIALNDLLQGQSSAMNRDVILTELKRQCIAMLAKEFDAEDQDDLIGTIDAVGERNVEVSYRRLRVTETPDVGPPASIRVAFQNEAHDIPYPLPRIEESVFKGRYVQFLEQAFEWNQLAYVFYPYFWAKDAKWIDLMNRQDAADPSWTAFLRSGSVKVLLAVTPAYDDAVLHYIATGTPWEGGPAPVIGDPLFVPLYEELRKQQDDLAGAIPEGEPWTFTVPTSLVYLENSSTPLPASACPDMP